MTTANKDMENTKDADAVGIKSTALFCCPNCGGKMEGDGYTRVVHCEFVDAPFDIEADANPIFCKQNSPVRASEE